VHKKLKETKNTKFSEEKLLIIGKCVNLIDDIKAIVFYLDKQGPELTYQPNVMRSPFSEADFIKMSTFYYMAVGQGNTGRNTGLYELPVPGHPEFHAIIFAFEVLDPENEDPRDEGKNYCLLVILHPRWFRKFLYHPSKLELIIQEYLLPYYRLEDFKNKEIVYRLLTKIIPEIPTILDIVDEDVSLITEINASTD
jgi:hypothetical protein